MKTVNWTATSLNDTNIVAHGFDSLIEVKKAVDAFCISESRPMMSGKYPNRIVADGGFEYPDALGTYYFSTDCISA